MLIDNVSEIPLDTQVKILRVLTDQKFRRVNGTKNILTNVRVFATTSKDLRNEIINGNFREDLFQRVSVMQINLPSLKNRIDDLPDLFEYFNKKISQNLGKKVIPYKSNLTKLYGHDWDGNIRELRNLVERLIILSDGKQKNIAKIIDESIQVKKNNEISSIVNFDSPLKNAREQFEREYLMHQLKKNGSNVSKTAENIGMERSALHRKLTSLGIAIK